MARKHEIPWAPVRRLLKQAGGEIVAKDAVKYFTSRIEENILDIAENAVAIMRNNKRKTLYTDDIRLAYRLAQR